MRLCTNDVSLAFLLTDAISKQVSTYEIASLSKNASSTSLVEMKLKAYSDELEMSQGKFEDYTV